MRIISGSHKGRILRADRSFEARPTTDFAKEALFDILNNYFDFENLRVLDLFAGTGGISYEFASRGAIAIDAVEINERYASFIRKTVQELDFKVIRIFKENAFTFIKRCQVNYDIIFADPPYDLEEVKTIPDLIFTHEMLAKEGWLIVEHSKQVDFKNHPNYVETRKYGAVHFSFFKKEK